VVVPFDDDEETLGRRIRQAANHLADLGLRFEILAVDEGAGDNSHFVLQLVHREIPELAVFAGASPGRGFARGAEVARGRALILIDPRCEAPLAPVAIALRRLEQGADVVTFPGRMVVARRAKSWDLISRLRGRMPRFDTVLARRARHANLTVEVAGMDERERGILRRLAARGPLAVFARLAGAFGTKP
jgi:hypothetical protein